MIGVFDSGYGGLTILRALRTRLPMFDYCYLGDNARAPYGVRDAEDIYRCTRQGVAWLFAQGAPLVILGCNTASANALRRLQQEDGAQSLGDCAPHRRVLGILAPTVEAMSGVAWNDVYPVSGAPRDVVVFATPATVASMAYTREVTKRNANVRVLEHACPSLAPLIEAGADRATLSVEVARCVAAAKERVGASWPPEAVLLGCTHYALIADCFAAALPDGLMVYDQGTIVADALVRYLACHPEIETTLATGGTCTAATTGNVETVARRATIFFDAPLVWTHVRLPTFTGRG